MSLLGYLLRWPLRLFVPMVLLGIVLGTALFHYGTEARMRQATLQQKIHDALRHELHRVKTTLEYLLLRGDLDRVRYEVAELGALPGVTEIWLTDPDARVIASSRMAQVGKHQPWPTSATLRSDVPWIVAEDRVLHGYQPVIIQRTPDSLRPVHRGLLYIGIDLVPEFAKIETEARREALKFGGYALMLALFMWWYFTHAVSQRLLKMERVAQRLAQSDFQVRLGLEGGDELARAGQAFDRMAEELQEAWAEHQRQQTALAEVNAELESMRLALDEHATVSMTDTDGRILYVNDRFCQTTGYTRQELLGQTHRLLKSGAHSPEFYEEMWRTISSGKVWHGVVENRSKNGTHYWLQTTIVPVYDAAGVIRRFVSIRTDITEMKRVQDKLEESEQRFRKLFEDSAQATLLIEEGRFIEANHAALAMLRMQHKEQICGLRPDQISPPLQPDGQSSEEKVVQVFTLAKVHGNYIYEWEHLRADGEPFLAEVLLTVIPYAGRDLLHVVWRDITDRKRLEKEQERLRTQLQQAQKMEAIGQLTGGIAHDFNNILAAILGYTGLALERCVPDPQSKLAEYLREVQKAGERARDLISRMLAFSRSSGWDEPKPLILAGLAEEAVKMLTPTLPSSLRLHMDIDAPTKPVLMDAVDMHQILINLIVNARDATGETGRIEIGLRNRTLTEGVCDACQEAIPPGEYVELRVQDDGTGIPEAIRHRLFEPFFTTKEVGKGSGMGLAVVHGLVHKHGGHILVESIPGKGTIFRLLFSYAPSADGAETSARPAAETPQAADAHVLVVDDEPMLTELLKELLEAHGYRCTTFTDSRRALAAFRAAPSAYDVLLTDQTMPGLTGDALAREVLQLRPGLPVILCTGYSALIDKAGAEALGIRHFFHKPVPSDALLAALAESTAAG